MVILFYLIQRIGLKVPLMGRWLITLDTVTSFSHSVHDSNSCATWLHVIMACCPCWVYSIGVPISLYCTQYYFPITTRLLSIFITFNYTNHYQLKKCLPYGLFTSVLMSHFVTRFERHIESTVSPSWYYLLTYWQLRKSFFVFLHYKVRVYLAPIMYLTLMGNRA